MTYTLAPAAPLAEGEIALGKTLLQMMVRIRALEEGIERHFLAGEIPGFAHLSIGQEAVAAGVCAALRRDDYIASTHRGHGHTLAKGAAMKAMVAELFARSDGMCRGKGGSMHIADFSIGMLGANGVVAGGFGLVAGAALAARLRKTDQVAVCFFGDGATNRGPFHENLNLAAIWDLPALFVLENNRYASTTSTAETMKIEDVAIRADGYGMPARIVDGFDAVAVHHAALDAIGRARRGAGPTFIECKTYRVRGHYIGDPERYRTKDEVEAHKSDDPIVRLQARLAGELSQGEFEALWDAAKSEFAEALSFARASAPPETGEAFRGAYAGDRDPETPHGAFALREEASFAPFFSDAPSAGTGSVH